MREPLLEDSFSRPVYSSESEKATPFKRRQFLQTVGLAGVALALAPKVVLAEDSDFVRWRDTVTGFIYTVCEDRRRADWIVSQVSNARLRWASPTRDFHYYYAAPILFVGTTVSPVEVICGNGFAVDLYPFYDQQCPCGSINDLNAHEMKRVANANEIKEYKCVLTPYDRRSPLEYADHANYRRTASNYGLNPDQYEPVAKRVFRGKRRAVYGFQIVEKTPSGPNGKPKKDVLLSSEDI